MVDDVNDILEASETKAAADACERARIARERRETEQRRRLEELRSHAAAAQAQRERRDEDRRRRQAEQRARDDDRRLQVEERKRAIWEASVSRREALLQREKDREERMERARATRSSPRSAFAFGSSTPRLLEPADTVGFFWAARSTNPIDQMNFFESLSLAASTSNVMFASAPLTRRASALHLDGGDGDCKEDGEKPQPAMWTSVARRRTDLVPTVPAPRAPEPRSGDTTPGSRPGSAMSGTGSVVRRPSSTPRRPRPASIAGTGVNTPKGCGDSAIAPIATGVSVETTPSVSRDGTSTNMAGGDGVIRRPMSTPRRPRPISLFTPPVTTCAPANRPLTAPGEGKPPLHRKPKLSKEHEKTPRGIKTATLSPGQPSKSPSPNTSKEPSVDKENQKTSPAKHKPIQKPTAAVKETNQVNANEVTQKLEALQLQNDENEKRNEGNEVVEKPVTEEPLHPDTVTQAMEIDESVNISQNQKTEEKDANAQDKTEESEMTASMTARRITTEGEAKAALAERRRRAREELEKQAELERQRLQREAEEEAERIRQEEERQRREEEEARELAMLQRKMEEEKLKKAIEAQQQLEREAAERSVREEAERRAKQLEEETKRRAAEEAERLRREEAEREERERNARRQRVEAIMTRTRQRKAEEEKKQQEDGNQILGESANQSVNQNETASNNNENIPNNNGNSDDTADLLGLTNTQSHIVDETKSVDSAIGQIITGLSSNGNIHTEDLLGLSTQSHVEHNQQDSINASQNIGNTLPQTQNSPNNGNISCNIDPNGVGNVTASFIQNEKSAAELNLKSPLSDEVIDYVTHNGHSQANSSIPAHPLTVQNAI